MKRLIAFVLLICLSLSLLGCQKVMKGTDDLIAKAREDIPVADAENIDITYAGLVGADEYALIWFISGNAYQAHYYLPMGCKIVGRNAYTFEHAYKPYDRGNDVVAVQWRGGYAFLINNANCTTLRFTDSNGTHYIKIEKEAYPFIYYSEEIPSEYYFLDAEGKGIP